MDRISILSNGLEVASIFQQKYTNPLRLRQAWNRVRDLHEQTLAEAGSNEVILQVAQTATEDEKNEAVTALGWTPNPNNIAILMQLLEQLMAMFANKPTPTP